MMATKREGKARLFCSPMTDPIILQVLCIRGESMHKTNAMWEETRWGCHRCSQSCGKHFERLLFAYKYNFLRPSDQCVTRQKKYHSFPIRIKSSVSQTGSQNDLACAVYVCVYFGGSWLMHTLIQLCGCMSILQEVWDQLYVYLCMCVCESICTVAFLAHIAGEHSCVNARCLQPLFFFFFISSVLPQLID